MTRYLYFRRGKTPRIIIRIGRTRPLFSERHQGTRGIPVQWHYLLGRRISIRIVRKDALDRAEELAS